MSSVIIRVSSYSEIFRNIIMENFPEAKCYISEINTNPILYM